MISDDEQPGTGMAHRKTRLKDNKKLTERINLRVTDKELELLERARRQDDRSLSNWARRVLVREARRQLEKKS